ncbi:hypothetical protein [Eubacterium ramulus]|uniref:hypothetical protein n=1 Tax=Eubacterium ramulus TaxID=39490 RepID=UPI0022DEA89F|nr:hypothetical protein [Eubacterium ramulus]
MKSKIAMAITGCGVFVTGFGAMGLSSEGQAGFVLAVKITLIGLTLAGSGVILEKLTNKKSVEP